MDREKLVEAMAEKLADVLDWMPSKFPRSMLTEAARAALAVAEPVVRADERLACLNVAHRWTRGGHSSTALGIILGIEERTGGSTP